MPKVKGNRATLETMTRNKNSSYSLSRYLVPAVPSLSILHVLTHFAPSQQSYEVDTVISPILPRRKLRHRQVMLLAQSHPASKGKN